MPSITDATNAIVNTLMTDFPDVDWIADEGFASSQQQLVSIEGLEAVPSNGHPWPIFNWTITLRLYGREAATELCALVCYWIQTQQFHPEMHTRKVTSVTPVPFYYTETANTAWAITFTVQGLLTPNDDVRPNLGGNVPTFPLTLIGVNVDVVWGSE